MTYKVVIRSLFLFICICIPVLSCVEPITPVLNENDSESMLVVTAQITDEEGPFKVKLTNSVPVNVMYFPKPIDDAEVVITDDHGSVFHLKPVDNGWYETSDKKLKGLTGYTYTLHITTKNGILYESTPVLMQEVPDIDSIYYEEVKRIRFEQGQNYEDNWLNILLDAHDEKSEMKYWRFEFEETWQVELLTDNVLVEHTPPGTPDEITWERVKVNEEKKICWVTMPSNSILVSSTVNNPVDEIKRFQLQSLGPGEDKLHIRYSVLVKQSSISRELYDFWKQLMDANENVGGIYDKIPAQVFGNISCCNGTTKTLGYFSASAVREKRLFIDRTGHQVETASAYKGCRYFDFEQLPWIPKFLLGTHATNGKEVYSSGSFCADCRDYGTNVKPDFWK